MTRTYQVISADGNLVHRSILFTFMAYDSGDLRRVNLTG